MDELKVTEKQTPIEIALGIDEKGRTTAKKLYEFLEMDSRNYSRWCKANIIDNQFAEENVDFEVFVMEEENPQGGRPTQDFKLTADFAKKLSMTAKNEKGESARDYFIGIENGAKKLVMQMEQLSPELQMFNKMFQTVARQELEQKKLKADISDTNKRIDDIREVVALDTTSWRDDTGNILRKIGIELGGGQAYSQVRAESYKLLEKRMGVSLKTRQTNRRRRMADEGVCKSTRDKLSYVDVVAEDKKLIEGYMAIVKEMAIKYGVAEKKAG